ncbi:murein hydrolase activator EnvC family protein [Parvibaculum lavamentivorans]|nr:peptidoglycan DD-metalloendopeptidase family protein [Parvibaculum lavamentivorans]
MEPGELDKLQRQIDTSRERQKELQAQAAAARQEADEVRGKLIEAAARVQAYEAEVSASEERLQGLKGAEAVIAAQLERRRDEMAELLAALTRLDRHPPPALAVRPDDALASIRSALLLGAVVPELQTEATDLRDRLEQLAALREDILSERETLGTAQASLEEERRELEALHDRKLVISSKLAKEAEGEQETAERLSKQATDISDLIARLEASAAARLPAIRPEPARPEPEPSRAPAAEPEPQTQVASVLRPPSSPPVMPSSRLFSDAKGLIRPPAAGTIVQTFGSRDAAGARAQGLTLVTRQNAQIVAPFDGRISYAGPFRHYGQLLIISVGEGYHVLLAGMSGIDCVVGQSILAGEPIGTMGRSAARNDLAAQDTSPQRDGIGGHGPALYIEFRKDGDPIDPRPWLLMSDKKARG